jgi:hypothetical protein
MNLSALLQNLLAMMQVYYSGLATKLTSVVGSIRAHVVNTDNPHQVDKVQVGLGRVQNFPIATEAEALDGLSNSAYMTPLRVKQALDAGGGSNVDLSELEQIFNDAADELDGLLPFRREGNLSPLILYSRGPPRSVQCHR